VALGFMHSDTQVFFTDDSVTLHFKRFAFIHGFCKQHVLITIILSAVNEGC